MSKVCKFPELLFLIQNNNKFSASLNLNNNNPSCDVYLKSCSSACETFFVYYKTYVHGRLIA